MDKHIPLKRTLSLPMMVLYGLGTTIGAGIYALVGEVAGLAGYFAPISFLIASLIAGFTAISFAELSSRFPRAAGAALYVQQGFSLQGLSLVVGLLVIAAGLVSASALVNAFVGYLHQFVDFDSTVIIVVTVTLLGALAVWGIFESVLAAALITLIEVGGLLLVIYGSAPAVFETMDVWSKLIPPAEGMVWAGIFSGTILAFYAFIGFEDMVDVAEEVKVVKKTLPRAILLTLGITTILYFILLVSAVLAMPPGELAKSEAPLADIYAYHTGGDAMIISVIGLFAIINGALIQMIMASRVLYGLSSRAQLPELLCYVHPKTRTPVVATLLATATVLMLALIGTLAGLAAATSILMLVVFSLVNLSLWRIKMRGPAPAEATVFPLWVPVVGFMTSSLFVAIELAMLF